MAQRMRDLLDDLKASLSRIDEADRTWTGWYFLCNQRDEVYSRYDRAMVRKYISETTAKLEAGAKLADGNDRSKLPSYLSAKDFFDAHEWMRVLDKYDYEGPKTPEGFGTSDFNYDSLVNSRWSPIHNWIDWSFIPRLEKAFEESDRRQSDRVLRYGKEVAENSRRGLTPSPAREEWQARLMRDGTLSLTESEDDCPPTRDRKRKLSTPPSTASPLPASHSQQGVLDSKHPTNAHGRSSSTLEEEATRCGTPEQLSSPTSKANTGREKADSVELDETNGLSGGEIKIGLEEMLKSQSTVIEKTLEEKVKSWFGVGLEEMLKRLLGGKPELEEIFNGPPREIAVREQTMNFVPGRTRALSPSPGQSDTDTEMLKQWPPSSPNSKLPPNEAKSFKEGLGSTAATCNASNEEEAGNRAELTAPAPSRKRRRDSAAEEADKCGFSSGLDADPPKRKKRRPSTSSGHNSNLKPRSDPNRCDLARPPKKKVFSERERFLNSIRFGRNPLSFVGLDGYDYSD